MLKSVTRLEQALGLWEDKCFFYSKLIQLAHAKPPGLEVSAPSGLSAQELRNLEGGPFAHSEGLRTYLLNSFGKEGTFEFDKYIGTERFRDLLGAKAWLPMSLWAWTAESRRVYQLSRELQLLLGVTSLNDVTWGDIHFPFDSFAIALEDPLVNEDSGEAYDLLLMSKITKVNGQSSWDDLYFTLFPTTLGEYKRSTPQERKQGPTFLRNKNWRSTVRWIDQFQRRFGRYNVLGLNFSYSKNLDAPIIDERWNVAEDSLELRSRSLPVLMKAARLVAGLALYFRSLPPGNSYIREETPGEKRNRIVTFDRSCISDMANICTVSSSFTLTLNEIQVLTECATGVGGHEVRAHFRCGHWRRPPGLGSDATAEKTVWVRPTLVRRDRVAEGSVPGGSVTKM